MVGASDSRKLETAIASFAFPSLCETTEASLGYCVQLCTPILEHGREDCMRQYVQRIWNGALCQVSAQKTTAATKIILAHTQHLAGSPSRFNPHNLPMK